MKQKKLLAAFLAVTMTVACQPQAVIAEEGDYYYDNDFSFVELEDGTLAVTGYFGNSSEIVIPSSVNGKIVTVIESKAFYDCTASTISIPESVTEITTSAFAHCKFLTSIDIPHSVTKIGKYPFANCESLKKINVDQNNNNFTSVDGVLFTKDMTYLIQYPAGREGAYIIPEGVAVINQAAFSGASKLTSVELSSTLLEIVYYAFTLCSSLTEINIPDSVEKIDEYAFPNCSMLESINVSENNEYYSSIDGVLFNKDASVLLIYPSAKKGTEYIIPESAIAVGGDLFNPTPAFSGTHLKRIIAFDGVTVGDIRDWSSLSEFWALGNVNFVAYTTFIDCSDFVLYVYEGTTAEEYAKKATKLGGLPNYKIISDISDESGIKVTMPTNTSSAHIELAVEKIDESAVSITYNISLWSGETEIQPESNTVVRIPVPEGWDTENIYVYHRDANGRLTEIKAAVSGGYIIFTTNHFSEYVLTTEKQKTTETGDVDGNGEVDELDSVMLARKLAGWNV